jgi:hypothetical protein
VTYRATVTTETRDFADSDLAQAKVWGFRVRRY